MTAVTRLDKPKAPYAERENLSLITRKGGERDSTSRVSGMAKKAAIKQAKGDAESMYRGGEGLIEPYEKYKLSSDPSREEITKRLSKGDVKAEKPLSIALQAADDAELAGREAVRDKLKTSAKPKPGEYDFKKGGKVKAKPMKAFAKGGSVRSAASRGDGCATKGHTKGAMR